jgi:hypothetical protein
MKTAQAIIMQIAMLVSTNRLPPIKANSWERTLPTQYKLLKLTTTLVRETLPKGDRFRSSNLHNRRNQLSKKRLKWCCKEKEELSMIQLSLRTVTFKCSKVTYLKFFQALLFLYITKIFNYQNLWSSSQDHREKTYQICIICTI